VTAATGTVGSALVAELRGRGVEVRAFVRDAGKAAARLEGVELARGDFSDVPSVERALVGVDRVFLACGNVLRQVEHETKLIDAAARAGVQRIVKLSALGARADSPLSFWDWHGRIEERLRESAVDWTLLRPPSFMTNLLMVAPAIAATGKLFAAVDDARIALVDPCDVASVAAEALVEDGHEGVAYVPTGPEALTYGEIARVLSEATGRTIDYIAIPDEAARAGLVEAGLPDYMVDFLVMLAAEVRAGAGSQVTDTVRAVTGREPRAFAEFAREHASAFRERETAVTA
jgi:uncharacterized protein YbjT (DUF2867 family)